MKRIVLTIAGLIFLLLVAGVVAVGISLRAHRLKRTQTVATAPSLQAGDYLEMLSFDGRSRTYIVHVPPGAAPDTPLPLVLALHGGGGTADRTDDLMKLTPVADRARFLVVFPNGVDKGWNDGRSDGISTAAKENIDDVGFLRAMVDAIAANLPIDRKRIYATGISNGGFMSSRLACDASDLIAAAGIVVATAPKGFEAICNPGRPVPIIAFNGTDDPLVPFGGGEVRLPLPGARGRGQVVSADALKRFWVANNRCDVQPAITALPDLDPGDGSTVISEAFGRCRSDADVVFYRIEGGGHAWPGGRQYLPERLVGRTNRDISASELIWLFFSTHPMP